MSRDLPARPSLEHLKKQAKELLSTLRQHDARATLAKAQHRLARGYGFKSWRALKTQVENAAGGGDTGRGTGTPPGAQPDYVFERYTAKARAALFFSRYEAAQAGSPEIVPAHLLLGLVRAGQDLRSRLFARLPLDEARMAAVGDTAPHPALPSSHVIPFAEATKRTLLTAVCQADGHAHRGIGIVHLLLGLLDDEGSRAAIVLTGAGIQAVGLRRDIERLIDEDAAI